MAKKQVVLPLEFYLDETRRVARNLIGKKLTRVLPSGERLSGLIVETEAYLGAKDPGAHTYKGRRTERVRSMYLGGGHVYVYFIYGNHYCMNVVTGPADFGQAVLIRALEPLDGLETMHRLRHVEKRHQLTNGPGKLCEALAIDRALDGSTFFGPHLLLEDVGYAPKRGEIKTSARIGLASQNEAAHWPLRYLLAHSPYISKKP